MTGELSLLGGPRAIYAAALCTTLWTLCGVFFLGWGVGELFFWAWLEIMLAGILSLALLYHWHRRVRGATAAQARREVVIMFGQLFLIVLLSFCFSLGAWAEDFGHIGNMPRFLGERIASVGLCVTGYVLALWVIWRSPVFPRLSENDVMRPLTVKLAPMLVLYCVMVATQSSAVNGRHMMMAGILLAVKLWIEVQALVGARVKN